MAQVEVLSAEELRIYSLDYQATGYFTDYKVSLQEIYRGMPGEEKCVTLRIQKDLTYDEGGQVTEEAYPVFAVGDRLVVFLYRPHMGGGFNTAGDDYYYLTGYGMGAYSIEGDKATSCLSYGESYAHKGLLAQIAELNKVYEVDEYWVYHYNVRHTKEKLENGQMSQKEYDDFWHRKEIYANVGNEKKRKLVTLEALGEDIE